MENNKRPETMARIQTPELARAFIEEQVNALRAQIGGKKVLLALSGGVDSSVVAALLIRAVGKQLVCVHVNHGLMRKGESEQVIEVFRHQMDANLIYVDAVDRFLDKLAGVAEPEQKRKIIGAEFIRVFEEEARKLDQIDFLAQGTIYPDIIESGPVRTRSAWLAWSLACPSAWYTVSPSPAPAWACGAWAPSPGTGSTRFARPTPSCGRSSTKTA